MHSNLVKRYAWCVARETGRDVYGILFDKMKEHHKMHNSKKVSRLALSYYDLEVFRIAFKSAMLIYNLSRKWPAEERYSLTDQIRRASRSVCSNIAEAWLKRRYPAHFISKLSDADSESAETEVWLHFAFNCEYLEKKHFENLKDEYDHICRMLTIMMSNANKWKLSN